MSSPTPVSARTKFPNTKASDAEPRVLHVVTMSDGSTIELMAKEPQAALEAANDVVAMFGG